MYNFQKSYQINEYKNLFNLRTNQKLNVEFGIP